MGPERALPYAGPPSRGRAGYPSSGAAVRPAGGSGKAGNAELALGYFLPRALSGLCGVGSPLLDSKVQQRFCDNALSWKTCKLPCPDPSALFQVGTPPACRLGYSRESLSPARWVWGDLYSLAWPLGCAGDRSVSQGL